jgi:hypothetical protein
MTEVHTVTREELLARRNELLRLVGATLEELIRRAHSGELRDEEWEVWTEVCELQFLLGDEVPGRPDQ